VHHRGALPPRAQGAPVVAGCDLVEDEHAQAPFRAGTPGWTQHAERLPPFEPGESICSSGGTSVPHRGSACGQRGAKAHPAFARA
jgi:hypothetical protein